MDKIRIDKWLWAARFYKTRGLAVDEVQKGRVQVNGHDVKPSREVKAGDLVAMRHTGYTRSVVVRALSGVRGPAPVAQQLYEETAESLQARAAYAEQRRLGTEPALGQAHGRPTKHDRRALENTWNTRWSASLDDD